MSAKEYEYIADTIFSKNGCNLLVFGVGVDSKLWLESNQKGKTLFLEDSEQWLNRTQSEVPGININKVTYGTCLKDWRKIYCGGEKAHTLKLPAEISKIEWDVILVDGPCGYNWSAPGRMLSIFTASKLGRKKLGADIFVHDFDRKVERAYCTRYFGKDELVLSFDRLAHFKTRRKEPLKILFATSHHYIPQRSGGSESSTHDLCMAFIERGYACAVLANLLPGDTLWSQNRSIAKKNNSRFPADYEMGYPVFRGPDPITGIGEIEKKFKPDVAIIQAGLAVPFAEAFWKEKIPAVLYIRDVEFHEHGGNYRKRPGLNFFANSRFAARRFHEKFNVSAVPIAPLISPDKYRTVSARKKVLFVCPHPHKGVETAFQLAESNPQIEFIFLESWPLGPQIKDKYITRAKKSGNIEWYSHQQDMKQFYSLAKIVLMPSKWNECWGRVITEAQVCGIPALASNIGGLPESVGSGGVLVNPEAGITVWSKALRKIMNDGNFYELLVKNALKESRREILQKNYILDQIINHISQFLLDEDFLYQNIKRNQPCPCGSGRKFKHCHGKAVKIL